MLLAVRPRATILQLVARSYARSTGPSPKSRPLSRVPFDRDQNEDGFMVVGQGAEPSTLRPNLNDSSSSTSDDNWAQILRDVDPPSHSLLYPARLRPNVPVERPNKRYSATRMEKRAMDDVFERVFNMEVSASAPGYPFGNNRHDSFLSNTSSLAFKRPAPRTESNLDILVDKKREEMYQCKSDQELLQWAMREVFLHSPAEGNSSPLSDTNNKSKPPSVRKEIQPEIYGRVIASLMVEFREQYNNPHLAVAIFDYTRRLSIISYVTGCTAPSYNELMRTHWSSFRNLPAVVDAAEEMRVNGVLPDQMTSPLFNQISDEIEPRVAWAEEGGPAEVTKLLERLIELLKPPKYQHISRPRSHQYDQRKSSRDNRHIL